MINKYEFLEFLRMHNIERDITCDECPLKHSNLCEVGSTCCDSLVNAIERSVDNA